MRNLLLVASTSLAFSFGAAHAQAQTTAQERAQATCVNPAETVTALQSAESELQGEETLGRSAMVCGNRWSAANLLEKANARRPTATTQFNLAAAYVSTGRYEAATELFKQASANGANTNIILDPVHGDSSPRRRWVNVRDEADRRIAALALMTAGQTTASQPFTAEQAAVNASERTGAPVRTAPASERLSDEEALARDGLR